MTEPVTPASVNLRTHVAAALLRATPDEMPPELGPWLGSLADAALAALAEWLESDDPKAVDLWTQGWTGPCINRYFVTMLRGQAE